MQLGIPSRRDFLAALENGASKLRRTPIADLTPTPSTIIDEGPQRTLRRYEWPDKPTQKTPVLLVPPLAAPVQCFDLRRDCSLAEFLVALGYPTYLVDYGRISFDDRELGLEHWIDDVIPKAAKKVRKDNGAKKVQLIGWSLGGVMALLSVADGQVPASSVAMVGSPFDFAQVRLMAPIRRLAQRTGGAAGTALYRVMGGAPAPIVGAAFRASALDRLLTKPFAIATHLGDTEWLAQVEAVDNLMSKMIAYPGRTFGQLYHQFFIVNQLSEGKLELSDREIDLANVKVPVLNVAGTADVIAPIPSVHCVGELVPNSPDVRLPTAPGGHLGVLTGRSAERTTWKEIDRFLLETA